VVSAVYGNTTVELFSTIALLSIIFDYDIFLQLPLHRHFNEDYYETSSKTN
jgi:hypothetical protein